jgi:hypothetical protein
LCTYREVERGQNRATRMHAPSSPRWGKVWRGEWCVRDMTWCDVLCRVVHERGLVLPLGLAKEEEGVQVLLWRSYLWVSYHALQCLISLALPFLPSPCCLTRHTIPSSCWVASEYSPSHPLHAWSFGRAGLRNWHLHCDTLARVCAGDQVFGGASLQLLAVFFFIGTCSSPCWRCPFLLRSTSSTSRWTFKGRHYVHLPAPTVVRNFEQLTMSKFEATGAWVPPQGTSLFLNWLSSISFPPWSLWYLSTYLLLIWLVIKSYTCTYLSSQIYYYFSRLILTWNCLNSSQ